MTEVKLKEECSELSFGPYSNGYLDIKYLSQNIQVAADIYLYTDQSELSLFFTSLANDWRGWTSEKVWSSLENDLQLTATHNGLGHVQLKFLIKKDQDDTPWSFQSEIQIEAGLLTTIADDMEKLLLS